MKIKKETQEMIQAIYKKKRWKKIYNPGRYWEIICEKKEGRRYFHARNNSTDIYIYIYKKNLRRLIVKIVFRLLKQDLQNTLRKTLKTACKSIRDKKDDKSYKEEHDKEKKWENKTWWTN